ncbi:hypothetical protein BTM312_06580 [Helicobacter pylori]
MQNSANQFIQNLSNGSMPTMIVGVGVANVMIFARYFSGKIDKAELCTTWENQHQSFERWHYGNC